MRRRNKNFLFLICGIFLAMLCGELMVRQFVRIPLHPAYQRFSCKGYQKIPELSRDRELFWKPNLAIEDVPSKERGSFRVLCLGDSVTQGYNLESTQTYPYLLAKRLREEVSLKVEVLNAGCGGYTSFQGKKYLKQLAGCEPDLVICWFGVNDTSDAFIYGDSEQRDPEDRGWRAACFYFLKNFFRFNRWLHSRDRVNNDEFYENCEQMIMFAQEEGFKMTFVAPFFVERKIKPIRKYREILDRLQAKYQCPVLDVASVFESDSPSLFFQDICHPAESGNQKVADGIFQMLQEGGLLNLDQEWK